jgi:hypothetical protein
MIKCRTEMWVTSGEVPMTEYLAGSCLEIAKKVMGLGDVTCVRGKVEVRGERYRLVYSRAAREDVSDDLAAAHLYGEGSLFSCKPNHPLLEDSSSLMEAWMRREALWGEK